MAGEIAPNYFAPRAEDPVRAKVAADWRRAERTRLLDERTAISSTTHICLNKRITTHLDHVLATRFNGAHGMILAAFWPIHGEPDLRGWMAQQVAHGIHIALPVVASPDAPLIFRPWTPDAEMRPGPWNIPEPATDLQVIPQIVLAPLVGWDKARFRIGYGGGFYDRTLVALRPRPYAIGIGHEAGHLETIHPQPHDEAMDLIITECGAG